MRYDDGFIAYLNGVRLVFNLNGVTAEGPTRRVPAVQLDRPAGHDDAAAALFQDFDISAFLIL